MASLVGAFGSSFLYGYNLSVVNAPTPVSAPRLWNVSNRGRCGHMEIFQCLCLARMVLDSANLCTLVLFQTFAGGSRRGIESVRPAPALEGEMRDKETDNVTTWGSQFLAGVSWESAGQAEGSLEVPGADPDGLIPGHGIRGVTERP